MQMETECWEKMNSDERNFPLAASSYKASQIFVKI